MSDPAPSASGTFDRVAARLLAAARSIAARRRRRGDQPWRDARWLWPHFGKD